MSPSSPQVRISVLGTLHAEVDGRPADLGSPKQRQLLALLLARPNKTVSVDQLIDELWDGRPPRSAKKNVQACVCGLRKLFPDHIEFTGSGYLFQATAEELDSLRFDDLAADGRRALRRGDRATAARVLGEAVGLWRDSAFADLRGLSAVADESELREERFLSVYEDWVEVEIELGRHLAALEQLDDLTLRFPTRERLAAAAMTALVRCGRTREALARYDTVRLALARELGVEPSPALSALYQQFLATPVGAFAGPETDLALAGLERWYQLLSRRQQEAIARLDQPLSELVRQFQRKPSLVAA